MFNSFNSPFPVREGSGEARWRAYHGYRPHILAYFSFPSPLLSYLTWLRSPLTRSAASATSLRPAPGLRPEAQLLWASASWGRTAAQEPRNGGCVGRRPHSHLGLCGRSTPVPPHFSSLVSPLPFFAFVCVSQLSQGEPDFTLRGTV